MLNTLKNGFSNATNYMKTLKINWWTLINSLVLIFSAITLMFFFAETVYRDNYIKHKNDENSHKEKEVKLEEISTLPISRSDLISQINERLKNQFDATVNSSLKVCEALYAEVKTQNICVVKLKKVPMPKDFIIDENTYPELSKLSHKETEEDAYIRYLRNNELGDVLAFSNRISAPILFIMIFILLGLSSASIGNLVIDTIHKKKKLADTPISPLVGLVMGPVVSCLVGALLVYVFTPNGESHQYFSRKILNTPIAVFISSFLFAFSPIATIQNIASFLAMQLNSLVGETGKHAAIAENSFDQGVKCDK